MATATGHDFPLATNEFTPADGVGSPDGDAGAVDREYTESDNGKSGGMYLPQGALIAIIVVAAVIAVVGGMSPHLVATDPMHSDTG